MKKLLIIVQKVDQEEQVLSFFVEWIREFSQKFEKVTVICLKMGEFSLPANVKVLSLGKESGVSKFRYVLNFYRYIIRERNNYDVIFVHNNPRYIILGWPVWKILNKKISLWYAHGYVPLMLKVADKLTDVAFTSTSEGYRIKNSRLNIVGQGIDTERFKPRDNNQETITKFRIISVGRISPSKDYETLIKAVEILKKNHNLDFVIEIAGEPSTEIDVTYLQDLKNMVKGKNLGGCFKFIGPMANSNIPRFLQSADIFVNMSHTGSLDKAILEAMACGLPVLTCNEALSDVLGTYKNILMYPKKDFTKLSDKIKFIADMNSVERNKLSVGLRAIVEKDHNLTGLIEKFSAILNR